MRYRAFRTTANGQWTEALLATSADEFSVSESVQRAQIADILGMNPDDLETVESDDDPRTGDLIEIPEVPIPEPEPDPRDVRIDQLEATNQAQQDAIQQLILTVLWL